MLITPRFLCICVPSKARAELFAKRTLAILRHTNLPWFVFIEPQDTRDYYRVLTVEERKRVVQLTREDQGFGYVLNAMREYCVENKVQFLWKMDDDVKHWYSTSRVSSKEDQGKILNDMLKLLHTAHLRIGNWFGGISFPQKYMHDDWRNFTHVNKMFQTTFIVDPNKWLTPLSIKGYHDEFLASARLISDSQVILRVGKYCWDADLSCEPGGLQLFDRVKEQDLYFTELERRFPQYMYMTQRREYTQKNGKVFVVTDKTFFNKVNSIKLPITGKCTLNEEVISCLSKLP